VISINERLQYRLNISQRYNPWLYMLRVARVRAKRPLCLARRHARWERETTLTALASGRSKRCGSCNRLVLKKEFR
jgi:hypothetical protein